MGAVPQRPLGRGRALGLGLGYSAREADQAIETVSAEVTPGAADVTALLRAALRTLSRS